MSAAKRQLMESWIKSPMTGCRFAPLQFNHNKLEHISYPDASLLAADRLHEQLEWLGREQSAAMLSFPYVEEEAALLALIETLCGWGDRWTLERRAEAGSFGLYWRTEQGDHANILGLGPLLTMPVTRRAPCFGMVFWPGGRRRATTNRLGLGDIAPLRRDGAPLLDEATRRAMFRETQDNARGLLPEARWSERERTSFYLSAALQAQIGHLASAYPTPPEVEV